MSKPELILPRPEYLEGYLEMCREMKQTGITYYSMEDPDKFDEWKDTLLQRFEDYRNGVNLPDGYVPATTFWLVDGDELIGACGIRHRLNDFLEQFGGHIGYAIRPSKWRQGYGTLQLKLALQEAGKLGIERVLITCDDQNIGSARVIEKNGGVHQDTIDREVEGKTRQVRRYWIQSGGS